MEQLMETRNGPQRAPAARTRVLIRGIRYDRKEAHEADERPDEGIFGCPLVLWRLGSEGLS